MMRSSARFAAWLAAKLAVSAGVVLLLWWLVVQLMPPAPKGLLSGSPRLTHDLPFTLIVGGFVLLACGLMWLIILDQRYRCRICVRRLRMPQTEGRYSSVLLGGIPYTEYICTYGHGKLYVPEFRASYATTRWTHYESLWDDLMRAETAETIDR